MGRVKMTGILWVEESENDFARTIIKRKDINLAIIRFSNCLSFSAKHLEETQNFPTFVINKSGDFEDECTRLHAFLEGLNFEINVFYNDSEFNQVFIQKVSRRLGLPGALSEYQAQVVRDKLVMKRFIREIGLTCPNYKLLKCTDDLEECINEWGFPFIIKWRNGVSSIEVYKVKNREDISQLALNYRTERYIAEQYLSNKIWCIDAIVQNGNVISNLYTWLPYTNLSFAECKEKFTQLAVGQPQSYWKFDPQNLTQLIISSLGLGSGYLHLEVFVSDDGQPSICEFAWRTPGDHMLHNFTVLYGRSVENMIVDALIGTKMSRLPNCNRCVADAFLPLKAGKITKLSTIDELGKIFNILDGEIYYQIGDDVVNEHKYTNSSGWVQVQAENITETLNILDNIYSSFIFEVEGN